MFTDIQPKYAFRNKRSNRWRIIAVAILLTLMAVIALAILAERMSVGGSLTPAASVIRPLDEAGFGSVRTLLIASMEPRLTVSSPIRSCSPFGSLTACVSDHFAALTQIDIHAPI